MDSFAYDSSHSFLFERFAFSKDENKETIPKKLMKEGEDHERWTFIAEDTIIINLGTTEVPQENNIGESLTPEEQEEFISLLREFIDVLAWSYRDTPSIDRDIAEHKIHLYLDAKPIKRKLCRIKLE